MEMQIVLCVEPRSERLLSNIVFEIEKNLSLNEKISGIR